MHICFCLFTAVHPRILDRHWTRPFLAMSRLQSTGASMGRSVRDAKLDNPAAREKLKARGKPYYGMDNQDCTSATAS